MHTQTHSLTSKKHFVLYIQIRVVQISDRFYVNTDWNVYQSHSSTYKCFLSKDEMNRNERGTAI